MSELICDDCGTLNSDELDRCELCDASLSEERNRRRWRSLAVMVAAASAVTLVLAVVPGMALEYALKGAEREAGGPGGYFEAWRSVATWRFWGIYGGLYFIGYWLAKVWRPTESRGVAGNPWSVALGGRARRSRGIGFLLIVPLIVGNLWAGAFRLIFPPRRRR